MWANKTIGILADITGIICMPLQLVSTTLLGCLVAATFQLALIPINIIWIVVFLAPLYGTSWLWTNAWPLRITLAIIGIPWAVIGNIYASVTPSMGDWKGRYDRLILCQIWPYSYDYFKYISPKGRVHDPNFGPAIRRLQARNSAIAEYIQGRIYRGD